MRVLVVEDNLDLQANIAEYLEYEMDLDFAYSGDQGLELATTNFYDVIVLDLKLPGRDGIDVCQAYRRAACQQAAIIMLTARDTIEDKEAGFGAGADDYLVKPFSLRELRMRIEALTRRPKRQGSAKLTVDGLTLDRARNIISGPAGSVHLHAKAAKMLELMMENAPDPVTRDRIAYALWKDEPPDSGALRTHVYHLRRALSQIGLADRIETVRGKGYALAPEKNG